MKRVLAVREIAYFIYSSGDLSSDFFSNSSASDGKKAHQYIQRSYDKDCEKEYYIKYMMSINDDDITIHGYIDGIIHDNGKKILEEIKSTKKNLEEINLDYHKEHLAQLRLYAYMYGQAYNLDKVSMKLTYIRIRDYEKKEFFIEEDIYSLKEFFLDSINRYLDWIYLIENKNKDKLLSIKNIKFPYSNLRDGQNDLMKASYYTLSHNEILYAIAPTGIGKTMATLFSGLKALNSNQDKLFYLTSKNMQKNICIDSIKLLLENGLKIKALALTSKSKSCLNYAKVCDPLKCKYAKGFFDRLKPAFDDIYAKYDLYTYDIISNVAKEYEICPFEFSLYLSYFCDLIICDYNYVFDPKAHLIRYFDDDSYKPKILIDEAHNLVSRAKDMYSSLINFKDIIALYDHLKKYNDKLFKYIDSIDASLKNLDISNEISYYSFLVNEEIYNNLFAIKQMVEDILSTEENIDNREEAMVLYFILKDFIDTIDYYGESHRFIINRKDDDYELKVICLDASEFVYKTIKNNCCGTLLFSATLYPMDYYKDLLTKGNGKHITFKSPFDVNNLDLIINTSISTRYKDRENTIGNIINIVDTLVNAKKGNYIVFFPSYKYIDLFLSNIDISKYNLIIQHPDMNDIERFNMFETFKDIENPHLGLFVLGGSFSEGIDFPNDLLNGVVIVGVGIPQINLDNELLKDYYEDKYECGYDYAYTYPGFNKVIQAAGRVIRTETDRGVVILIDERYKSSIYSNLMPAHWNQRKVINSLYYLKKELEDFFKKG